MTNKDAHKEAYKQRKLRSNIWDINEDIVLFKNPRTRTITLVFYFSAIVGIVSTWFVLNLEKGDVMTRELSALELILWQFIFITFANSVLFSFFYLSGRYILKIKLLPSKIIEITTWGCLSNSIITFDAAELIDATFIEGNLNLPSKPLVFAPYINLKFKNHKKLLLDMQGEFPHGYLAIIEVFKHLKI
ncbi:hypothetical protein [Pedobacter flavus]|uniref:DUF304 domain-containing protein n=1 Tax=Pedobacter flavus TaxID=3113906 RepID=A0ABU7H2C6_9SPHI|nr:hypothetical protein [Pedobacter sp. VNH31]MEE1885420.1 hypothetical protein [Pedobacter sp. VNH31]